MAVCWKLDAEAIVTSAILVIAREIGLDPFYQVSGSIWRSVGCSPRSLIRMMVVP